MYKRKRVSTYICIQCIIESGCGHICKQCIIERGCGHIYVYESLGVQIYVFGCVCGLLGGWGCVHHG